MIKRIPQNAVLVELEKLAEDEYQLASGVKLYINTTYKPEQHQRIFGKCVAIPDILTKDGGMVRYEVDNYMFLDSIVPEVRLGDTVYFNYTSVNKTNLVEYEGKSYYRVDYSSIICVVRKITMESTTGFEVKANTIIPIGGNVLCEEYYGENAESVEIEGRKVFCEVSPSGMITGIIKKASETHAVVKIIGSPLKDDCIEVKQGDVAMFPYKFGFKNNIEGTDYLVLKYWDVQAVIGKVNQKIK